MVILCCVIWYRFPIIVIILRHIALCHLPHLVKYCHYEEKANNLILACVLFI